MTADELQRISNQELRIDRYPFTIGILSSEDGGGYLIEFPDVPGCISDGETPEEAIQNGKDALRSVLLTKMEFGHGLPEPGSWQQTSGPGSPPGSCTGETRSGTHFTGPRRTRSLINPARRNAPTASATHPRPVASTPTRSPHATRALAIASTSEHPAGGCPESSAAKTAGSARESEAASPTSSSHSSCAHAKSSR
jgi:predicted RNase H-like HicB family nuclease